MASFSVGFAQVEDRLRSIRRRLNLLMVQDAVYVSSSAVMIAAALVIALAIWRGAPSPVDSLWMAGLAGTIAVGASVLQMQRRWLTREAVVHLADRRAALDDRLATLLLDPSPRRPSGLSNVLLDQILAAAPRWDVDVLAPRRVPRSIFILAAALSVLAITTYFARPPARPLSATVLRSQDTAEARASGESPRPRAGGQIDAADGQGLGGAALGGRSAGLRGDGTGMTGMIGGAGKGSVAAPVAPADKRPGGSGAASGDGAAGEAGVPPNNPAGAKPSAPAGAESQIAEKQTKGAPQTTAGDGMANGERGTANGERNGEERGNAPGNPAGKTSQSASGEKTAPRPQAGSVPPAHNSIDNGPANASGSQRGSGSAPGGGPTGTGDVGLFAAQPSTEASADGAHPLPVALGAFSTLASSRSDPQRPEPAGGTVPRVSSRAPLPLAAEQIPDAPLQKVDLAPEHEPLIRRIFTPDE